MEKGDWRGAKSRGINDGEEYWVGTKKYSNGRFVLVEILTAETPSLTPCEVPKLKLTNTK